MVFPSVISLQLRNLLRDLRENTLIPHRYQSYHVNGCACERKNVGGDELGINYKFCDHMKIKYFVIL